MGHMTFDEFCVAIKLNRSLLAFANRTLKLEPTTLSPVLTTTENITVNETNATGLTWFAKTYDHVTEESLIPALCILAIVLCIVLLVLLNLDTAMRRTTLLLHRILIIWQLLHATSLLLLLELKAWPGLQHRMEILAYVSAIKSMTNCGMTWTLVIVTTDAFMATRYFYRSIRLTTMLAVQGRLLLVLLVTVALHLPHLPPIRVLLYSLDPVHFRPCVLPVLNLWEGHWDLGLNTDYYYIVYFYVFYVVMGLAVPYLIIACKDKDIIDLLHWVRIEGDLPREALNAANTAMSISVLANTFLVCFSTKLVLLIFGLFQHALEFINEDNAFFHMLNTTGNVMAILWVCATLPVLAVYNPRLYWMVMRYPFLRLRKKAKRTVQTQLRKIRAQRHESDC